MIPTDIITCRDNQCKNNEYLFTFILIELVYIVVKDRYMLFHTFFVRIFVKELSSIFDVNAQFICFFFYIFKNYLSIATNLPKIKKKYTLEPPSQITLSINKNRTKNISLEF